MPVQCACVNLTIARVRMILKREFGWTTQGSRILLLPDDLNPGPGTGQVVTFRAAGSHRIPHRRVNSPPAQQVKNLGVRVGSGDRSCSRRDTKMMQTEQLATQPPTRGRQIKFTPERLQQI